MRKLLLLMLLSLLLLSTGCTTNDEEKLTNEIVNQLESPPKLMVIHNGNTYEGVIGTSSWSYDNGDGSFTATESDSGPPHELVDYQNQSITVNTNDAIEIYFYTEPNSYTIEIWYDYDDTEKVVPDENIITIPDSHDNIIYSVHAYFDQGNAYYAFEVEVNNRLESDD